jgi:hypothetical protein
VNPAGTVDQKTNIVSREDDYVELRDDTLVPDDFKNEKISSDGTTYRDKQWIFKGGQTTFNIGRN